ncbi:hypothetical protein SEA_CRICKO_64 [Streptomyces phage CricKo]|nr:hypothetical protein SEA_RAINYDAI_62 [Streptomyces phage Rainydai]QJD49947.1 hypothetical protein SEA_CRICKO_64 [Streptomyces phage CricKo]QNL30679.1 hypothetical protein SEA_THIQQUMS_64 [Streptomyces phage Thiqqums]
MKLTKYSRRTFDVDAVQITDDNIEEVCLWIGPNFSVLVRDGKKCVLVPVLDRNKNPQKSVAFVGDWVTRNSKGEFAHHKSAKFRTIFKPAEQSAMIARMHQLAWESLSYGQKEAIRGIVEGER